MTNAKCRVWKELGIRRGLPGACAFDAVRHGVALRSSRGAGAREPQSTSSIPSIAFLHRRGGEVMDCVDGSGRGRLGRVGPGPPLAGGEK